MALRYALGLVVAWLAMSCAGNPQPTERPFSGQRIILAGDSDRPIEADTVRFGHLYEGEIALRELMLCNHSERPVVITHYERTCGCTTLEYEAQPLMPGEERKVRLLFDARGAWGWQFKLLHIHLAEGGTTKQIVVEADIE